MNYMKKPIAVIVGCVAIPLAISQAHAQATPIPPQAPVIAAGSNHTVLLKSDGSLWTWGSNQTGQLGDGTRTDGHVPKQVGTDYYTSMSSGYAQTFALKADGSYWGWGDNRNGQFGDATIDSSPVLVPTQITASFDPIVPGFSHTVALDLSDSSTWAWGSNAYGQVGNDTRTDSPLPVQIDTLNSFTKYAVGYSHSVALDTVTGSVWTWGYNWAGQLGDGSTLDSLTPKQVVPPVSIGTATFWAIAAGGAYTVALDNSNTATSGFLWAWGRNQYGQLGDGTTVDKYSPQKIGTAKYTAIATGDSHTVALDTNGNLWAWGNNAYGQLGDGTTVSKSVPTKIGTDTYSAIAAGMNHTVALLKRDGSVWAWGANGYGQLGDGTTTDSHVPKLIGTSFTPDSTAPTIPSGLSATLSGTIQVNLVWSPSTDNVGVTGYQVFRNGALLATTTTTSYNDTGLTLATTYRYAVKACDQAGNCSALSVEATATTAASPGTAVTLASGWNLMGNSVTASLGVASVFGNASNVLAVWKWNATKSKWAFYSPSYSDGGAAYAAAQGYDLLTTINGGEGFWVNAKTGFTAQFPSGTAIASSSFQSLPSGWSLIAVGDRPTPSLFNNALSVSPPSPGTIPINLTTLWVWDNTHTNWEFYAPSLEAKGGTALADFISGKGYLGFGTNTISPTTGFWVNKP